jgi:hypothetical protein
LKALIPRQKLDPSVRGDERNWGEAALAIAKSLFYKPATITLLIKVSQQKAVVPLSRMFLPWLFPAEKPRRRVAACVGPPMR